MEFTKELDGKKYPQYDIPVYFLYQKLNRKIQCKIINNEKEFIKFLTYLYCVYRKIEIKMGEVGYLSILPDPDYNTNSFMKICINLDKAKEEYKSMRRNDFLEMYPVLKKLFFSYMNYIRYSIEHMHNMDEGDHLPITTEEIKCWLQELNTWSPTRNK